MSKDIDSKVPTSSFSSPLEKEISRNILEPIVAKEDVANVIRSDEKRTTKASCQQHNSAGTQSAAENRNEGNTQLPESSRKQPVIEEDLRGVRHKIQLKHTVVACKQEVTDENQAKFQGRVRDISSRSSFLQTGKSMPVHMLHPHPHRRHYPHHLLDHFSGDLSHQTTASATWVEVIPAGQTASSEATTGDTTDNADINARGRESANADNSIRERGTTDSNNNPARVSEEQPAATALYPELQEPQAWPFFGAESRVLPSGRRVSFLRQACLGFTSTNTAGRDKNDNMETICPKAFREASFTTPRRTFLRSNDGSRVAELRRRFTDMASNTPAPNLNRFKYETVKGPSHADSSLPEHAEAGSQVITGTVIIDSSSTKGSHPVPKAPGLRSPGVPNAEVKVAPATTRVKFRSPSPAHPKTGRERTGTPSRSPVKATSPSPTRQRSSPSPTKNTAVGGMKGPRITKPEVKATQMKQNKPASPRTRTAQNSVNSKAFRPHVAIPPVHKKDNVAKKDKAVRTIGVDKPPPKAIVDKVRAPVSSSSDSLDEGSSLVMVQSEEMDDDDVTSTYEELSNDASVVSDRNFLVDYGDPSRFYFRNEWEARMRGIDEDTSRMKEKLRKFCPEQVLQETIGVLDEVENIKQEMEELYDYFDHFEREEDTLLQQVQRQLVQANKYCKVLQYRLEKAEQHRHDDKRVKELEEELKLSRQVAVSLHWELQGADTRQAKLEQENARLRRDLLAAETSRQALKSQVEKLQHDVDQMSLHAPSQIGRTVKTDDPNGAPSGDTTSEMRRQVQFMEEKEEIMLSRLVDFQKEKDSFKDELDQYREQYGELANTIPTGTSRQTDLKLRLKLAEDQAGLLARKVIDLQLENDNMIKLAAEKELIAKEVVQRNPSVSDLQFLEDERESLRLALDEMEIENQKLAAELLRYKQAVHRQLHSNSSSTESPLDVGVMIRVPRSNDSVFDEDGKTSTRSHKHPQADERSSSRQESISEHTAGDRNKLRLSLTSPLNQSQKRSKMSISRTLSDIAIPLSPDAKSPPQQTTPNQVTLSGSVTPGPKSHIQSSTSRKSSSTKSKRTRKVKMVDAAVETERVISTSVATKKPVAEQSISAGKTQTRSQATSPIITNIQNLLQPAFAFVNQMRKTTTKSEATSPMRMDPPQVPTCPIATGSPSRSHNVLLDEMRRQLACVRNIAESMDTVVDVEEMEAELERKGKAIVNAERKRIKERVEQKRKIGKMARSLQKHIKNMESSVSAAEGDAHSSVECASIAEVAGWDLHGNAEVTTTQEEEGSAETPTLALPSSSTDDLVSMKTVRSLASAIRTKSVSELSLRVLEGIVLVIIAFVLLTSLPASALIKICFLLVVFFVC